MELARGKKHIIIKRDGREEPFDIQKLRKVVMWATDNNEAYTNNILESLDIKINDRMRVEALYDELISTAVNNISRLYPFYDEISKRLLLLKIYKETAKLKRTGEYPHLQSIIDQGVSFGVYDKDVAASFSAEEIDELSRYIQPDRDFLFTYKGLSMFNNKYCKAFNGKKFELPQIAYMVVAMYSFFNDDKSKRIELIKKTYDMLSLQKVTFATPRVLHSFTNNPQLASCVLNTVADDTWSLNQTDANMATYSKYAGGIAYDISYIRATGSSIRTNRGKSNGPIPFIKRAEQTISSFDQGGARKGACVVTFPWWHLDVMDLIMLKDAGGTEDNRARKLVYAIKLSNIFKERVENNEEISLFDPKDVPLLNTTFGKEFEEAYVNYENTTSIRKNKIPAKELLLHILKVRQETGNLYLTFIDNINKQNMLNTFVGASNLCQEVVVPSFPSELIDEKYIINENGDYEIIQRKKAGEIGICNLVSINLVEWVKMNEDEKSDFCYTLLRGCDNVIDTQYYPVKEGKISNVKNRPIGVGVLNYANLLASNKLKYTDPETEEFTNKLFDDVYYHIYKSSNQLAVERGPFSTFKNTKWADGKTPLHMQKLPDNNIDMTKWDELGAQIKQSGVRFSLHAAIAPTATSGKSISATESIEPIVDLFFIEEGIQVLPSLAPRIKENGPYYQRCWEIPAKTIVKLGAIRQQYIDQAQSMNLYYVRPESARELWEDIKMAMENGVKTLYYMKTPKSNFELEGQCDSCT